MIPSTRTSTQKSNIMVSTTEEKWVQTRVTYPVVQSYGILVVRTSESFPKPWCITAAVLATMYQSANWIHKMMHGWKSSFTIGLKLIDLWIGDITLLVWPCNFFTAAFLQEGLLLPSIGIDTCSSVVTRQLLIVPLLATRKDEQW